MSLLLILTAFGGGIFAAAIGGLAAFIFTGIAGLIGIAVILAGGEATFVNQVAFGSFFGPHIAFAGAVAAAAYSAKKKYIGSGMDIVTPLFKTNDASVLLVGGVFGALGCVIQYAYGTLWNLPVDSIGLTVVTSAVIVRLVFGSSGLTGKFVQDDQNPTRKFIPDTKTFLYTVVQAAGLSIVVAYLTDLTHISYLGFCISAVSLMFAQMGFGFPATHHITWVAGVATATTGNIYIGVLFGVIAALVGELAGRTFNSYTDTHIDPPATTIAVCSLAIFTLFK